MLKLGIAASPLSTLHQEQFAEVVRMTECYKIPIFKFIIMSKPVNIEFLFLFLTALNWAPAVCQNIQV